MFNKKWIISLILVLALTMTACTSNPTKRPNPDNNQGNVNQNTRPETNINQNTRPETNINQNARQETNINNTAVRYGDIKVTPKEAYHTFTQKYPDAKIEEIDLDLERGAYVYEVEGYDNDKKYELKINSMDGKVVNEKQDTKSLDDTEGEVTLQDVDKINNLIDKTLRDVGNDYTVKEWTLKSQNGEPVFKVEVANNNNHDIDYKYNVNTGEIIEKD